ncbi:hypothetical protein [Mycobacterium deserti]|uniref:Uncharacterized protein n=1 Tax=Mycobacterium deserti TaxID=2978347 RepID=A0ABT2MBW6_9MYCO|nr:hypothetical protein [Mycobacterium deserti]MCT7658501.1 hypothetical protein [Mycobacterium deserti]
MALTWWPLAAVGFACLTIAVAMAVLLPMEQVRRQLRPLANTSRLTRLPEYARLARARTLSMVAVIVLLVVLFSAAMLASARPSAWWWSSTASDAPEDIMLCVGDPVTDEATAEFLSYFAQQTRTFGTQRIGLTSQNRRVVPLTRDYQYAAERFNDAAELARLQTLDDLPQAQQSTLRNGVASFSPEVTYVDYAASVDDILALCMSGFPSFDQTSTHRRSLIYLGPGELRRPDETRPSLYSDQQITDMAKTAGIQLNAIASTTPGSLRSVVESTDGQYFSISARDRDMAVDLAAIRAKPPAASQPASSTVVGWLGDSPAAPLIVAVVASMLLCLSLMVLRR